MTNPARERSKYREAYGNPWVRISLVLALAAWGLIGACTQSDLAAVTTELQSFWIGASAILPILVVLGEVMVRMWMVDLKEQKTQRARARV